VASGRKPSAAGQSYRDEKPAESPAVPLDVLVFRGSEACGGGRQPEESQNKKLFVV